MAQSNFFLPKNLSNEWFLSKLRWIIKSKIRSRNTIYDHDLIYFYWTVDEKRNSMYCLKLRYFLKETILDTQIKANICIHDLSRAAETWMFDLWQKSRKGCHTLFNFSPRNILSFSNYDRNSPMLFSGSYNFMVQVLQQIYKALSRYDRKWVECLNF